MRLEQFHDFVPLIQALSADPIETPYTVVIKSTFLTYIFSPTLLYISKSGEKFWNGHSYPHNNSFSLILFPSISFNGATDPHDKNKDYNSK